MSWVSDNPRGLNFRDVCKAFALTRATSNSAGAQLRKMGKLSLTRPIQALPIVLYSLLLPLVAHA